MKEKSGVIYILTNPSFPEYVKIGYADNIETRLKNLNRSECIPYAFRLYAYYEVPTRLSDLKLHEMIDGLNPNLRAIDNFEGKKRVREFYAMEPEKAYSLLQTMAVIHGATDKLHKITPTQVQKEEELEAENNRELAKNRHHFKNIEFHSSLTNKTYYSKTKEDGTLGVYEKMTEQEIPNHSNPSKRQLLMQAVQDLGEKTSSKDTLYELQHKLEKIILNS